ncbi:hypothetical protein HDV00_009742 [Rhizophlyctis rosea]|nr:hypothetical protein HDV00_009742 [Rhizophlyctis rosea]
MSSQVNFSTFSKDLNESYQQVLSADDPINWAMYSYDKGGNDLKLTGSGDGGLEELQEEFEESKIQYAFARVVEPISGLPKFVLISWCGDGVPTAKKGLFHYHVNDVTKYFKGYHVHINARGEGDVDPNLIMKKVKDSSGAKYSIHNEKGRSAASQEPAPVGSSYVPVQTAPKPLYTSAAPSPAPHPSPSPAPAPAPRPSPGPTPPRPAAAMPPSAAARFGPAAAQAADDRVQAERERREREEREARERAEREAADREARDRERERQAREETERRLREQSDREERDRRESEERDARARADREAREAEERRREDEREREAAAAEAARAAAPAPSIPSRPESSAASLIALALYDYAAEESNEISLQENEHVTNIVQIDEGWWQGTNGRGETGLFPANYVELVDSSAASAAAAPSASPSREPEPVPQPPTPETEPEPVYADSQQAGEEGAQAVALYDYDAAEENEVTFREGDIITGISMVSDDWWQGYVNGKWGLFPGNYVELKQ